MYRLLLSDPEFRALNIPIPPEALRVLDQRIWKCEPTEPVIVWNGYILTGYEINDISLKYHRNPATKDILFPRRTDAIAWLCQQQLKRTDLSRAAIVWLTYRLYEAMRDIANRKKAKDEFQYRQFSPSMRSITIEPNAISFLTRPLMENNPLLSQLGKEFNLHKDTIRRYVQYGRRIDKLEEKASGIRIRILTGDLTVMLTQLPDIQKMPAEQLKKIAEDRKIHQLIPPPEYCTPISPSNKASRKDSVKVETAIKQMPIYDPDANINGLKYTISSWRNSIARTIQKADLRHTTIQGRDSLKQELHRLITEADNFCATLDTIGIDIQDQHHSSNPQEEPHDD